jgi:DNA polymerase-3 subunit epsilon
VAWRIASTRPEIGGMQLDDLHEAQVGWAREQGESLAAYFARTPGKEHLAGGVRTEWPLIPAQRGEGVDDRVGQ